MTSSLRPARKKRLPPADIGIYALLTAVCFFWVLPLGWLVLNSLRGEGGAYTTYLLPKTLTFSNFTRLFTETQQFNYPRWFANTLIVAVGSCLLSTLYVLMLSHAFSRLRFATRTLAMNVILVLGMFPGFMSMIAVYHILKAFGLSQSLVSLMLVYPGLHHEILHHQGLFRHLPRTLTRLPPSTGPPRGRFAQDLLPLSKPIITYTVLTFGPWGILSSPASS